jgi:hypothetical protein
LDQLNVIGQDILGLAQLNIVNRAGLRDPGPIRNRCQSDRIALPQADGFGLVGKAQRALKTVGGCVFPPAYRFV